MNCKECGQFQHACGSCGLQDWEYDYCNIECFKKAQAAAQTKLTQIVDAMAPEDVEALKTWYTTNVYSITEALLDKWLDT